MTTTAQSRLMAFEVLTNAGPDGLTGSEIQAKMLAMGHEPMTATLVRQRRADLVAAGLVTKHKERKRAWRVIHPRDAEGMQGCPCACGHVTPVSNWDWAAIICHGCGDEVSNHFEPKSRGRRRRAAGLSEVELHTYVSTSEADTIRRRAAAENQSVSTYLRVSALKG